MTTKTCANPECDHDRTMPSPGCAQRPTDEEIRARRERRYTWYGYLADDNIEHVAERIRNLLAGRRYTFVAYNAEHAAHAFPEVRTGQRMTPEKHVRREAVSVHRIGQPLDYDGAEPGKVWDTAGLSVADTYGVWGLHTSHATEAEAREDAVDPDKVHRTTYVTVEGGTSPEHVGSRSRIEVRHYNYLSPAQMLVWVIAVEPPMEES